MTEQMTATETSVEEVMNAPAAPPPAGPADSSESEEKPVDRTVPLSDGRVATLKRATGRHLIKASVVSGGENQFALLMGVVSQVATIDGSPVLFEDLQDMDAMDVLMLVGAVLGNAPSLGLGI